MFLITKVKDKSNIIPKAKRQYLLIALTNEN
jgi:hypothetical protein